MSAEREARRFGRRAVTVEEARRLVLEHVTPIAAETVSLAGCYGRRAAEGIVCGDPVPHFRRSGMDGYAVLAADTAAAAAGAPATLRVVGSVACGEVPRTAVAPGTAMRIMTGAMLPEGADSVVMLEMTEPGDEAGPDGRPTVRVRRAVTPGTNVSEIGSDLSAGTPVVDRGAWLGPTEMALLATAGVASVPVFRRPRVALLTTGTELLAVDAPLEPGKIRNSNAYMLAAQVASAGGEAVLLDAVPDTLERVIEAVTGSLAAYDLVITTGGVSVGDYDVMTDLLYEWDGSLLFNKVQMRPGSVTSAGVRNGKLLLALSGNPGACFAGFELFARPAIKAMLGTAAAPELGAVPAALAESFPKVNAYPRFLRGRCWSEGGRLVASPRAGDRSSRMHPGLGADCFVVIPPGGSGLPAGAEVTVIRFGGGGM